MRIVSSGRIAAIASLAVAVSLTAGCSWFKKDNEAYKLSGEARPLELPPEFSRPDTSGAMALPSQGALASETATRSTPSAQSGTGFTVAGERDAVFARIGELLQATEGLTIASRAALLGAYDVNYQGENFLVRASESGDNVYVSAVDPRGLPQTTPGASALLAQLKTALGAK